MKLGEEFKKFVMRGNVVDMAVGVIIGTAFGKIVSSFVADIFTPLIALALGKTNFSELKVILRPEEIVDGEVVNAAITWNYGAFIQTVIDFLIIALCLFLMVKLINNMREGVSKRKKKKEEAAAPAPEPEPEPEPEPSKEEVLLTEIRDLLKESKEKV
ncbi:MAG: large-conductance mechanosensitive channel protein MscL [Eubacteriales bacterium]|nr:large-conductance mechanosensitive channel protein MscL [Eubacteriales bacterium]